jgi:hypothetical protein
VPSTVVEFDFVASKAQLRAAVERKVQAKLKASQVTDSFRHGAAVDKVRGLQRMWRANIVEKRMRGKAEALVAHTRAPDTNWHRREIE